MHGFIEFNGIAKPAAKQGQTSKSGLFEELELIEITRESPSAQIEVLVGQDAVHSAGVQSVDDLLEHRLGGYDYNRSCFAVRNKEGELQSAIYLHKTYAPIASPRDLSGNVRDILSTPAVRMVDALPTSIIFYSITRLGPVKGAGEVLIRKLHDHLTTTYPNAVLSTLSPLRQPAGDKPGIDHFLPQGWKSMDDVRQRAMVLAFLLRKCEGVQSFHMGNGAIIGDIKLDADSVGLHRVMVNYLYNADMTRLTANGVAFRNAASPASMLALVSPALIHETNAARWAHISGADRSFNSTPG